MALSFVFIETCGLELRRLGVQIPNTPPKRKEQEAYGSCSFNLLMLK